MFSCAVMPRIRAVRGLIYGHGGQPIHKCSRERPFISHTTCSDPNPILGSVGLHGRVVVTRNEGSGETDCEKTAKLALQQAKARGRDKSKHLTPQATSLGRGHEHIPSQASAAQWIGEIRWGRKKRGAIQARRGRRSHPEEGG